MVGYVGEEVLHLDWINFAQAIVAALPPPEGDILNRLRFQCTDVTTCLRWRCLSVSFAPLNLPHDFVHTIPDTIFRLDAGQFDT